MLPITFILGNSLITPSNAYTSFPFNARQGLLCISMIGIPLCWFFSYSCLYAYFASVECKMSFRENLEANIEHYQVKINMILNI